MESTLFRKIEKSCGAQQLIVILHTTSEND